MMSSVSRLFQRRDPVREAELTLARISTLLDVESLPWESGVCDERRRKDVVHVSMGIWLVPMEQDQRPEEVSLASACSAVCSDLRPSGLGILIPRPIDTPRLLLAVPNGADPNDGWRFLTVCVCHQTPRPGGWHQLGLKVEAQYEPEQVQLCEFREGLAAGTTDC